MEKGKEITVTGIIKGISTKVKDSTDVITLITVEVANATNDVSGLSAFMKEPLKIKLSVLQGKFGFRQETPENNE